jgi:hypothetical protein
MASSVRLRLCFKRPSSTCLDTLPTPLCVRVCVCPERASEREGGREGGRAEGEREPKTHALKHSRHHCFTCLGGCVHARARSCTQPTLPHALPPISHFILFLSRFLTLFLPSLLSLSFPLPRLRDMNPPPLPIPARQYLGPSSHRVAGGTDIAAPSLTASRSELPAARRACSCCESLIVFLLSTNSCF